VRALTKGKPRRQASVSVTGRSAESSHPTNEVKFNRSGPGSATRILRVLECFLPTDHDLSLSQIAERLSMNKSSIHRALTTLSAHGLVEQDPVTRRYRLGIRLFEIGAAAIHQPGHTEPRILPSSNSRQPREKLVIWQSEVRRKSVAPRKPSVRSVS